MQPLCREIRTFAAACEHLISREPTTVLTDDEYSLLTYYIAELQVILKVRRTQDGLLEGPTADTLKERRSHMSSSASTCTVLLIEDDPAQLAFWSSALKNCSSHYSVLEAASGQEGLELLRHHQVDCVVLDLDLASSSGFQFLLDLVPNRNRPEIAVLIFTRLQNPTLERMSLEKGAQAYLIKQGSSADALDTAIQKAVTAVASALG